MFQRLRFHFPYLAFLVLPILFYHARILFQGEILCGGDLINQFVPWREFALGELREGRFPGWNPYVFCGAPFAANIQTALFYPWNLIHLFCSVERAFSLSLVFHHLLSLFTMYLFLNNLWKSPPGAVVGALIYGWSGFFITHSHDGHLIHIQAYAWLPLALYFQTAWREGIRFRSLIFFALCLAAQFYAGHIQIPFYMFYLLLLRSVWWGWNDARDARRLRLFFPYPAWTVAGLAMAAALSALVLLPLLELSGRTASRAGGADYEFATQDSLPPAHLITLAAPFFYGDPTRPDRESRFWETRTGFHEICGYAGILPLLLLLLGFLPGPPSTAETNERFLRREFYFFAAVAVGAICFAMGRYNPLYALLYYGLPGWNYFRVPGRLLLLFLLGVSTGAARGLAAVCTVNWKQAAMAWPLKAGAVGSVLFVIATLIIAGSRPALLAWLREFEIDRTVMEYNLWTTRRVDISLRLPEILFEIRYAWMLSSLLIACGWLAAGWLSLYIARTIKPSWRWAVPTAVVLLDLLFFSWRFINTIPAREWRETYFPQTSLVRFLQENAKGFRVLELDDAIGSPGLDSHPELRPNRLMAYGIESARGYDPIILDSYTRLVNRMYGYDPATPQGGLLFFPTPPPAEYLAGLNVRYLITTQELKKPFQLAWREDQSPVKIYEYPPVRPRVFLENPSNGDSVRVLESQAGEITLEAHLSADNRIIVSQNMYPGWTVSGLSGHDPLETYWDTFSAVSLPPGRHTITLTFHAFHWLPPSRFSLGFLISFLALAAGTGGVMFEKLKK
ncbi:MAG TPA: hypothetical protein PK878_02425 [bacterium]|nr:hypothetical protein [bacterium]HOL93041.1 hypothetical protein [bacterium]HPO99468.1 hypothetical protein [bacterium]